MANNQIEQRGLILPRICCLPCQGLALMKPFPVLCYEIYLRISLLLKCWVYHKKKRDAYQNFTALC